MPLKSRRPVKTVLSVCSGALLVAAGAFAMVAPDRGLIPAQNLVTDTLVFELPPIDSRDSTALEFEQRVETRIQAGDTVASILARLGIEEEGFMAFISEEAATRKAARGLVPGRTVQAGLDGKGGMKWIRYYHTPIAENKGKYQTEYLLITKLGDKSFEAQEVAADTESQMHLAAGVINSSLFGATDAAGVPDGVTMQMAEILGGKIDFLRDIRTGDEFRVLYETRMHEGRPTGPGRVLAVQYINDGKLVEAMWFAPDGHNGGYYDKNGKSLKAAFLRSAIPFTRVSSKFGKRMHPIHRSWKMHSGIDFAAPTGTPIRATGDGIVDFIGSKGGYGKTIILRHANNITTLFAHQSRFAKGLERGDRVAQGEIIGYVGSTGWSTGPHLHYEFRVNNKPVDPLGIKMPEAIVLDPKQREQFYALALPWRDQLERIAELQDLDANLSVATR